MDKMRNKLKAVWYVLRGRGVIYRIDFPEGLFLRVHALGNTLIIESTFYATVDERGGQK